MTIIEKLNPPEMSQLLNTVAAKSAYVVMTSGFTWGRGKTLKDAAKQAHNEGASKTDQAAAWYVMGDDTPEVNDMGDLVRAQGSHLIRLGKWPKLSMLLQVDKEEAKLMQSRTNH